MKKAVLLAVLAVGIASPALAADPTLPEEAAPAATWSGFFAGLHAGYGWGNSDLTNSSPPGPPSRTVSLDPNGLFGGVQAGYNWQMGNFVVGAIADFSIGDMNDSFVNVPPPGPPFTATAEIEWMATLRARAGALVGDKTLIYGHGGLAIASIRGSWIGAANGNIGDPWNGTGRDTSVGFVVGAGVEHKFTDRVSLFAEYAYADFGNYTFNDPPPGPAVTFTQDTNVHTVKVGFNVHF